MQKTSAGDNRLKSLTTIDLSGLDTKNVTDMSQMFVNMVNLRDLNMSNIDTTNVTDMAQMFFDVNSLTSLDLGSFDTSKVTNMSYMFARMNSLVDLNVSSFNTSKVTDMSYMFNRMGNLKNLDLSNFDTSSVKDMHQMFTISGIANLDLSNFDTRNVTDMGYMFSRMNNLVSLDISNFNIENVTDLYNIFLGTRNLRLVNMSSIDSSMLNNVTRKNLLGVLNDRKGPVAIVASPEIFQIVKTDNSGTVIGPVYNSGDGKFSNGSTILRLVKSQNIDPDNLYATLPTENELEDIEIPSSQNSMFKRWKLVSNSGNDLKLLNLRGYEPNFDTAQYVAEYSRTEADKNGSAIKDAIQEVVTELNTEPEAGKALSEEVKTANGVKSIEWKDADGIKTTEEGTAKYPAAVTFNDGSTLEIEVPVKVVDSRTEVGIDQAQVSIKVIDQGGDPVPNVTVEFVIGNRTLSGNTDLNGLVNISVLKGEKVIYKISKIPEGYENVNENGCQLTAQSGINNGWLVLYKKRYYS